MLEDLLTKLIKDDRLDLEDKLELLNGWKGYYEYMLATNIQDSHDFTKHTRELEYIKNAITKVKENNAS